MDNIRSMIRDILRSAELSKEKMNDDFNSLTDSMDKDILMSNIKRHIEAYSAYNVDIKQYISVNLNDMSYMGQLDDYNLAAVSVLLRKKKADPLVLQGIFDSVSPISLRKDLLKIVALFYSRPGSIGIEELKLGYEKGLDIGKIAHLLGSSRRDTHNNIIIFDRYRDFFESKRIQDVREFITAIRLDADLTRFKTSGLILDVRTEEDLYKEAPVIKADHDIITMAENMYRGKNSAYYYQDGDTFICKSLKDGQELATKDEGLAMSWVCKKNYQSIPVTRQIKRGK